MKTKNALALLEGQRVVTKAKFKAPSTSIEAGEVLHIYMIGFYDDKLETDNPFYVIFAEHKCSVFPYRPEYLEWDEYDEETIIGWNAE